MDMQRVNFNWESTTGAQIKCKKVFVQDDITMICFYFYIVHYFYRARVNFNWEITTGAQIKCKKVFVEDNIMMICFLFLT